MNKNTPNHNPFYLLILGLIDQILDDLSINNDRLEIRNQLLSAMSITIADKLLNQPDLAKSVSEISSHYDPKSSLEDILKLFQQDLSNNTLDNSDYQPIIFDSVKQSLTSFVEKISPNDSKITAFITDTLEYSKP